MQFPNVYHDTWMKGHFRIFFIGILGLLFLMVFSSACSEKSKKSVAASIPVIVSTVIQKTVPVQIRAIGNVQAYSTVTVKAKVGGELTRVHFTEGQDVRKGELLFTIDPRPYEAALKQAGANLRRDLAQEKHAQEDARRYEFFFWWDIDLTVYVALPQPTLPGGRRAASGRSSVA